jgi:hypothetical protein
MVQQQRGQGTEYFTVGDLAAVFKVSQARVKYAVTTYNITHRMQAGVIRLWHKDDLPAIKSALIRIGSNRAEVLHA